MSRPCECFYDETHDMMDREDCPFHHDLDDQPAPIAALATKPKAHTPFRRRRTKARPRPETLSIRADDIF
jgi:hypothetical protein